jgi:hypothetical protein
MKTLIHIPTLRSRPTRLATNDLATTVSCRRGGAFGNVPALARRCMR